MKHLRETFTDEEFEQLRKRKEQSKLNWHDFIMQLTKPIIVQSSGFHEVEEFYPEEEEKTE